MKRFILVALALGMAGAVMAGPRINSANAPVKTDSDGLGVWKIVMTDINGNTYAASLNLSIPTTGLPAYISGTVAGLGASVTAQPAMDPLSETTQGWVTFTASSTNITTAAGVPGNCYYCVHPSYGGSQIRVRFTKSATAPTDLYSVGAVVSTSATAAQCWGPFVPGTIVHVIAAGASSVTGTATFGTVR